MQVVLFVFWWCGFCCFGNWGFVLFLVKVDLLVIIKCNIAIQYMERAVSLAKILYTD
jgi:hypothetical protein